MPEHSFYVEITCRASGASPDELETQLEEVMEALDNEPGVTDADIGARLDDGMVDFCLHLAAEQSSDATARAFTVVRSALHASGVRTPGWDDVGRDLQEDRAEVRVRPADFACT